MIPQHSSKSNEHPTPENVVEAARGVLGSIDLDPASSHAMNERIRADRIFTIEDDGLTKAWHGRVFLNPPGGRLRKVEGRWQRASGGRAESSMVVWWEYLVSEWLAERTSAAVFVAFTLEILRISQRGALPVQAFPRCYPKARLCFGGDDPTHANVLVYLPPRGMPGVSGFAKFCEAFRPIGYCEPGSNPVQAPSPEPSGGFP